MPVLNSFVYRTLLHQDGDGGTNTGNEPPANGQQPDDGGAPDAQKSTANDSAKGKGKSFNEQLRNRLERAELKRAEEMEAEGIDVVYTDDGKPDWIATYKKDDAPKPKPKKDERITKLEAERDQLYIEKELTRATVTLKFRDEEAKKDAEELFLKRHTVKRDKRNGTVEIYRGNDLLTNDDDEPLTLAETFESWIATKPGFLAPDNDIRPRVPVGQRQTGVAEDKDSNFMNSVIFNGIRGRK